MNSKTKHALLFLSLVAVAGCATSPLPFCERFTAFSVNTPNGPGLFFDLDNVKKLADTLSGISEGKCRMKPVGAT